MEVGKLNVKRRNKTGKGMARKLRAQGKIPGVCYGAKLEAPLPLEVDTRELRASLDPTRRQNTVINMVVEGNGTAAENLVVMVKDYQIDPLRRELTHVDFVSVDTERPVSVEVPIELEGKAKGLVKGGQIHVVRHQLTIRAKPADIPLKVIVDITELDVGGAIHVSNLQLPAGVTAGVSGQLTIVTMVAPTKETAAETGGDQAAEGAAPATQQKAEDKGGKAS